MPHLVTILDGMKVPPESHTRLAIPLEVASKLGLAPIGDHDGKLQQSLTLYRCVIIFDNPPLVKEYFSLTKKPITLRYPRHGYNFSD